MQSDSSISVLVCSNKWSQPFEGLLSSLADQEWQRGDEIIVVLNAMGESDRVKLMECIGKRPLVVRYIEELRPGLGFARRTGMRVCGGKWILFLDDDNSLGNEAIRNLRAFMTGHPEIGGICPRIIACWETDVPDWVHDFGRRYCLSVTESGEFGPSLEESVWKSAEQWLIRPPGGGMIIRREAAEAFLADFSENGEILQLARTAGSLGGCEDAIIYSFVAKLGYSAAYAPSVVVFHHLPRERASWSYLQAINYQMMVSYGIYHRLLIHKQRRKRFIGWFLSTYRSLKSPPYTVQAIYLKFWRSCGYFVGLFKLAKTSR